MATEGGLGTSVLTLVTDGAQFFAGLDQAEKRNDGLKKAFDSTARSARGAGDDMGALGKKLTQGASVTDGLTGVVSKLGPALLATFSVAAVTTAIKSYVDFTGKIADMSAKTGIGAEALQRLKYAAEQNGASLDQVTNAVTKLGNNLAGGNKSAVGALEALGLSLETVRSMQPDKAFTSIADAIAKVPDPMDRAKLAMDLFGKSGADLLPMMTGNLSETAAAADKLGIVMSAEAVAAGDEFGDTMTSLMQIGQAMLGQMLTPLLPVLTEVARALGEYLPPAVGLVKDAFMAFFKAGWQVGIGIQDLVVTIAELGAKVPWLGAKFGATAENIAGLKSNVQIAKAMLADFGSQTENTGSSVTAAAGTMAKLSLNYKENAEETKKASAASKEHTTAVRRLVDSMGGGDAIKAANLWLEALPKIGGLTKLTKDEKAKLNTVMGEALDAYTRLGTDAPAALQQVWMATANLAEPLGTIDELWKNLAGSVQPVQDQWSTNFVTIGQKFATLQQEMTLSNLTGIQLRLAEIDIAKQKELESLRGLMSTHKSEYEQLATMVKEKYRKMAEDATGAGRTIQARARDMGFVSRSELQEVATKAQSVYEEMARHSEDFTRDEIERARRRAKEAKDEVEGKKKFTLNNLTDTMDGTASILGELGRKYKAAAIAGAIISTASAIAKALAGGVWPFSLVQAAAAGAAGWAQVNAIRNAEPGFKKGTPRLDFMDFGQGSQHTLHGKEAVIPQGGGHRLAGEIAAAMGGKTSDAELMRKIDAHFTKSEAFWEQLPFMMSVQLKAAWATS